MKANIKALAVLAILIYIPSCFLSDIEPSYYKERRDNHEFIRCDFNGDEWTNSYTTGGFFIFGDYSSNLKSTFFKDYEGKDFFEIYARRKNDSGSKTQTITIIYENKLVFGKNKLNNSNDRIIYIKDKERNLYLSYYLDLDFDNFINIEEIDEENEIIKGTFQFKVYTEDKKKSLRVLDGEFDLKIDFWRPIPMHHEFSCLINGEKWEVEQYFARKTNAPLRAWFYSREEEVIIKANNHSERMILELDSVKGKGEVSIILGNKPIFSNSIYNGYYLDSTYNNVANIIELDEKDKFVKGIFEFRAIKEYGASRDTITVTEGYFDSKCFFRK